MFLYVYRDSPNILYCSSTEFLSGFSVVVLTLYCSIANFIYTAIVLTNTLIFSTKLTIVHSGIRTS